MWCCGFKPVRCTIKNLEDRFAKQEQELPDRFDAFKSNVTSQLEEKISKSVILDNSKNANEDKEIDKRKNNMIIYRVPEVTASSAEKEMKQTWFMLQNYWRMFFR